MWSAGPDYYFIRKHAMILGLQFLTTGEHKDIDRFQGKPAEDTGITSVFVRCAGSTIAVVDYRHCLGVSRYGKLSS